ncbi:hypothetical protein CQW23_20032 [Capsicum baccatum]|uniref:Ubiquitin-like protease family profile domain-containing protein n=1 Tax=Capsicum baccatum TaxID=33114 RepID=A0A2G2W7H1_CAPBA|nr:hypothetical protein CQW23_20032 [Capsicum baccatum]
MLAVIAMKDRRIRVYNLLSRRRNTKSITEIQKLAKMLPTYLSDNKFYDETSHTDWPNLETYRDKIAQTTQILNEHPFDVEYVQHIMQQECDSVNCGVFVAGYAEYLSKEMNMPSDGFEEEYHRMRYTTLLRKYDIQKAKTGYVRENDDPPRSKSRIIQISDDNAIVCIGLPGSLLYNGANTSSSSTLFETSQSFLFGIVTIETSYVLTNVFGL